MNINNELQKIMIDLQENNKDIGRDELVANAINAFYSNDEVKPTDNKKEFKPRFNGFMKLFLHDEIPDNLASRATFTEQWTQSKRHKILKKQRRFSIRLHILDTDGNKRGHEVFDFTGAGGQSDLSRAIFENGNRFIDELRIEIPDLQVDLINSYAVVRA